MSVLREFTGGPFHWFVSTLELTPLPNDTTELKHTVRILPRGLFGKTLARIETGAKCYRSLNRVYSRIDQAIEEQRASGTSNDPFEPPARLSAHAQQRFAERLAALASDGVDAELTQRLGGYLEQAPIQEVAKIRPLALADRLRLDAEATVEACLHSVERGLVKLEWDILCPTCRVAADTRDTLKALTSHTHCTACNVDFESDLASAIELVFRVHPDLRATNVGKYCVGGPWHAPHVVAQLQLQPGERLEVQTALSPGNYLVRGPQLPWNIELEVRSSGAPSQGDFVLEPGTPPSRSPVVRSGAQLLSFENRFANPQIVRIERTIPRGDVLTAARASTIPRFREMFPGEVLDTGRLMSAEQITMLSTSMLDVDALYAQLGDVQAYGLVEQELTRIEAIIHAQRGEVVKIVGESVLAAFADVHQGVQAAFALVSPAPDDLPMPPAQLAVGVHRGPAIVTTTNNRLDYFGAAVRQVVTLPALAGAGVALSESVYSDPQVDQWLREQAQQPRIKTIDLPGKTGQVIQHFTPSGPLS